MDEKKFDDIMEHWAQREQSSAPRLRPTRDMYALLKTQRRMSWYPVMARWATVGVAAVVIVVVAIVHPSMVPVPFFQGKQATQKNLDDAPSRQEMRNEAKDVGVTPEQDTARGEGMADKEKQEAVAKKSDDNAEPAKMPVDSAGTRDIRQTAPETSLALSAPASEDVFEVSPDRQLADDEQIAEPLAPRPAPVLKGLAEAPAESPSFGDNPATDGDNPVTDGDNPPTDGDNPPTESLNALQAAKSRSLTEFGIAGSKMASQREQDTLDADRKDGREEKSEKPPLATLVLGDQMDMVVDCTPLPDALTSSPTGFAAVGRSSSSSAMLTETSEEAESETSTLLQVSDSPRICSIEMAERTIGAKTFRLLEHVWVDTAYDDALERLVIQRDSPAYAELLRVLPDMYAYAESGDHILVSLKTIAIEIAPEGQTQLTDEDMQLLKSLGAEIQ